MALTKIEILFRANINDMTEEETVNMLDDWIANQGRIIEEWVYDHRTRMVKVSPLLVFMSPTLPESLHTSYNLYVANNFKPKAPEMISIPKDEYEKLVKAAKVITEADNIRYPLDSIDSKLFDAIVISTNKSINNEDLWEWMEEQSIVTIESFTTKTLDNGQSTITIDLVYPIKSVAKFASVNNELLADFNNYF